MQSKKYVDELRQKTIEQLNLDLVDAKRKLFELRLKNATNQLENTAQIKQTRKNIARIQTIITIKQMA